LTLRATSGADRTLHLNLPVELPDEEYDIAVVLTPKANSNGTGEDTPESRGWPEGYFEHVIGSIDDDTFMRHPQGDLPKPVSWE
jgi:hypothetical protein